MYFRPYVEHNQMSAHINWMVVMWIIRAQMASVDTKKKVWRASFCFPFDSAIDKFHIFFFSFFDAFPGINCSHSEPMGRKKNKKCDDEEKRQAMNEQWHTICFWIVYAEHVSTYGNETFVYLSISLLSLHQFRLVDRWCGRILSLNLSLRPFSFQPISILAKNRCKTFQRSEQIASVDKTTKYKETNLFDQWQIDFGLASFAWDSGGREKSFLGRKNGPTFCVSISPERAHSRHLMIPPYVNRTESKCLVFLNDLFIWQTPRKCTLRKVFGETRSRFFPFCSDLVIVTFALMWGWKKRRHHSRSHLSAVPRRIPF